MHTDKNEVSAEAVALLTRELICEQIYRQREKWDVAHPNNALMTRDIKVEEIVEHVHEGILELNKHELRLHASIVLDRIMTARAVTDEKLIPMPLSEVEEFRAAGFIYAINKLILHPFGFALALSWPDGSNDILEPPTGVIMMKTASGQRIDFEEEHEVECKERLERTLKTQYWNNEARKFVYDNLIAFSKKDYDALRDAWLEQNDHYRKLAEVATKVETVMRIVFTTQIIGDETKVKMGVELANELLRALGRADEIPVEG